MTLRQKQSLFAQLVGKLIARAYAQGYELTLKDAYRSPEENFRIYGRKKNSVHPLQLAIDLNLFRDGAYLRSTESHRPLGEWWERQHPLCRWGGRFSDGNHYSLTHGGVS
jgi:hypothetical protein